MSTIAAPDVDVLRVIYTTAITIRQTDEQFRTLLTSGQVRSTYYSPAGQELIAAGVGVHLRPDDYAVTTYRGLHDQIAKGVPLRPLLAEYLGRRTGTCKGKGGPMHVTMPDVGLMVTTGIVGSGLPIANGLALAAKLRGTDQVAVANFGDGASNIGAFHEALNLAAVWLLPVVFVCQNNRYGEHTRYEWATSAAHVADRAGAYAMPGVTVDGNDAMAVYAAAGEAIARARAGGGPTLLECVTYRFHGHIVGDAMRYMPKEERDAAMAADPLPRLRAWLEEQGHFSDAELAAIEQHVAAIVDDAFAFAIASDGPELAELLTDVYAPAVAS
jgi:TPP-dependent pyruvate/acetoin dehydrogenase alpha subunit